MKEYIFFSDGYKGGATKFISQHIDFIRKKNAKIYLIDYNLKKTYSDLNLKNIKTIDLKKKNFFYKYKVLKKILFTPKKKFLFFTNFALYVKFFLILNNKFKNNCKNIITIHSGLLNFSVKDFIGAIIFSILLKKIDYVFFGSSSSRKWWTNFFPWIKNVNSKVVYNGIDIPNITERKFDPNNIFVSFVGRLEKENNPDIFINLAKSNCNSKLTFNIFGSGSLLNKYKSKYHKYCKFYGWKSKNFIYSKTDVLIITSKINNFPYTALEAKSFGIPVLTCSKGDIKKIIRHMNDGIIIKSNNKSILKAKLDIIIQKYKFFSYNALKNRHNYNLSASFKNFWENIK